jgi:hypothetical protein
MPFVKSASLVARGLAAIAVVTGALVLLAVPPAGAAPSPDQQLVALVNHDRAAAGLRALSSDTELASIAGTHSRAMADLHQIFHTPDLGSVVPSWLVVDENVAVGGAADQIERGFMASPVHRANVLDRRVTQVGVGVVDIGGQLWVTVLFRLPPTPAAARAAPAAAATPMTAPTRPAPPRFAAATQQPAPPLTPPTTATTPAATALPTSATGPASPAVVTVAADPVVAAPTLHPAAVRAGRSASIGGHNAIFAVGMLVWLAGAAIVRRGTADVLTTRRRATAMRSHPSQWAASVS